MHRSRAGSSSVGTQPCSRLPSRTRNGASLAASRAGCVSPSAFIRWTRPSVVRTRSPLKCRSMSVIPDGRSGTRVGPCVGQGDGSLPATDRGSSDQTPQHRTAASPVRTQVIESSEATLRTSSPASGTGRAAPHARPARGARTSRPSRVTANTALLVTRIALTPRSRPGGVTRPVRRSPASSRNSVVHTTAPACVRAHTSPREAVISATGSGATPTDTSGHRFGPVLPPGSRPRSGSTHLIVPSTSATHAPAVATARAWSR